ncbi:hypothetical protein ACQCU1_14640 [Sutcliffiella horikoshii]|uniref:hypothetical protein n=1 Tax=Sutcliffiella horikoshii TaxID=79883 RepID=UPI003CEFF123
MNNSMKVVYGGSENPDLLFYKGEKFLWEGTFLIEYNLIKDFPLKELPLGVSIQPLLNSYEDTVNLANGTHFMFMRTLDGIVSKANHFGFKRLSSNADLLGSYLDTQIEILKKRSDLKYLDYTEDESYYDLDYSFRIEKAKNIKEAVIQSKYVISSLDFEVWKMISKAD